MELPTKSRLLHGRRRLGRAGRSVPESGVFRTPHGEEWAETALSRNQLDAVLRKGLVHRDHGQP